MSIYLKTGRQHLIKVDGITITLFMIAMLASVATMTLKIHDAGLFQKMVIIFMFNLMGGWTVLSAGFNKATDRYIDAMEFSRMVNGLIIGTFVLVASSLVVPFVPYATLSDKLMNLLFMIAIATGEEFFFRYWIYTFLIYISGSPYISALTQAIIFALFHATSYTEMGFDNSAFILAFIAGIVFIWQDIYSGRLSTSVLTHIMWNTLPIILAMLG